ncbi:MAG: dihydrodipicolinate synthase family protein [Gemmatimonas sp.]
MTDEQLRARLLQGHVIPAHPLALTDTLRIDEKHQRALTRYYVDAGSGGIAVGVHTTGFPIHDPKVGLYEPVLALAAETATAATRTPHQIIKVAGLVGSTEQALREAGIARSLGYDCGLLSLGAWRDATASEILAHSHHVADAIPLFGFYLQPAVGGRLLDYSFWRSFCEISNVVAIKVAPFNRYATLDVVRALADSGRTDVALYTGNDDAIISDLVSDSPYADGDAEPPFVGGLLGQWAVWTQQATTMLHGIREWRRSRDKTVNREWLRYGAQLTQANAAIFDVANNFAGCLPGILEVLRQQGLVRNTLTFDDHERLSPGQRELIANVRARFPHLTDDAFVAENLDRWLR